MIQFWSQDIFSKENRGALFTWQPSRELNNYLTDLFQKKKRSKKHNSCFTSIWIQTKKMICIDCLTTSLCKALHKNFVRQFLNLSATVFFNSCMVNVVRFCQEFVHSTALLLATWIFSAGTCILYNIFPWKTFIRKWTELSTFCFCFLLCNYFTETWERVAQDEE